MTVPQLVLLGVSVTARAIHVVSSTGHRTALSSDGFRAPSDWVELATYGMPLPERHEILACVSLPGGVRPQLGPELLVAAQDAGWSGARLISSAVAAARALRLTGWEEDLAAVCVVDAETASVGIARTRQGLLVGEDTVRAIPGREAREVAVSLRCLLKEQPRSVQQEVLRRVAVAGSADEVERIGARRFETELESLGARRVEFHLEPFFLAQGTGLIAQETESQAWRRLRRRPRR